MFKGKHEFRSKTWTKSRLLRYPVGLEWLRRKKKFIFAFLQKFQKSKWPPFLGRGNFLEISYYSVSYKAIFTKSIPMQAINLINTHTKFGKDRINTFP